MRTSDWITITSAQRNRSSCKKSTKDDVAKKTGNPGIKRTRKHLETFKSIIGKEFIYRDGDGLHPDDQVLLRCEDVEMNGDIPAVLTRFVANQSGSFDQLDPMDIRYVMEQLDPDNKLSGWRIERFNMRRTKEQFADLMTRLEKCDPNLNGSPPRSPSTASEETGLTGSPVRPSCASDTVDADNNLRDVTSPTTATPVPPRGDGLSPTPLVDSSVPVINGGRRDTDALEGSRVLDCRNESVTGVGEQRKSCRVRKKTDLYIAGPARCKTSKVEKISKVSLHTSQSQSESSDEAEDTCNDSQESTQEDSPDICLRPQASCADCVLPYDMDFHAAANARDECYTIYSSSDLNEQLFRVRKQEVVTLYTDGSHFPRTERSREKAGWGVVVVKGGGLKGADENNGEVKKQLKGPVVTDSNLKGYLANTHQKLSNNTADLSAIGEALLYLLGLFNHRRVPKYKFIVIRYDSAYAANAIRGTTRANENKDMIFEIRRHYQCLLERLKELNIRFGWSHVPAHSSFRWNDQVDALL